MIILVLLRIQDVFTDHCPKWSLQAKSQHTQMTYGLFVGTRLHTELSILGLSLGREWGLHKYSGVSYSMGFVCSTEEDYFCQITAYIKAHVCLYCFWHPGPFLLGFVNHVSFLNRGHIQQLDEQFCKISQGASGEAEPVWDHDMRIWLGWIFISVSDLIHLKH